MAIHGQKGNVYHWNGTKWIKILETTGWTLNVTQQTAEAAVQEEEYITRAAGAKDWNVSIEGLAQTNRDDGNIVNFMVPADKDNSAAGELIVRLRNDKDSGKAFVYQGKAFFTDVSVSSPEGGLVTVSATLAGNGLLTYAAAADPK